jgi:hypothetical protein
VSAERPSHRDPDAVLAELGRRLDRAYSAAPGARRGGLRLPARLGRIAGRRRWVAAGAVAALLVGPTAIATHDTLFTTAPPTAPGALDGPGALTPDAAGTPVYVADGTDAGVRWRLSASLCRYGAVQAVGLFLDVPGGGAGARCDVAARGQGTGYPSGAPSPAALRDRRIQSYIDPVSGRTWVFGVLPPEAAAVVIRTRDLQAGATSAAAPTRVPTVPIDPRAVPRGVPAGLRVFAVALPGAREVAGSAATTTSGTPVLRCGRDGRCLRPTNATSTSSSHPEESRP